MDWEDIRGVVSKVAPVLGGALGGGAGLAVGQLIATALGTEATPEAVHEALQNNPDALLKLKKLEFDAESNVLGLELADKQDARKNHNGSHVPALIALSLTFMVGFGGWFIFTTEIVASNKELAYMLFGAVLAKWGDSIAYFVGTTRSSSRKTELLKGK